MLRKSVRRRRFSAGAAGPQTHAQGGPHVWPACVGYPWNLSPMAPDTPPRTVPVRNVSSRFPCHLFIPRILPPGEDGTLRNAALRLQEEAV